MTEPQTNLIEVIGRKDIATANDIVAHVARVREIQKRVMIEDQHYGTIPGTDKDTLLKPGAELLCLTFHINTSYRIVDASDADCRRYRVVCTGTHQGTGVTLGEGAGSCSTNEAKYKWRRTYNAKEWATTDESRKKLRFGFNRTTKQEFEERLVRTEPDDLDNTVLKMACKRALVAMVLAVTAASDIFAQDLEDMPEGTGADDDAVQSVKTKKPKPRTEAPRAAAGATQTGTVSDAQVRILLATLAGSSADEPEFCIAFEVEELAALPAAKINDALEWIRQRPAAVEK